jgi:endonuclease/exonuclease/phosphatase family metal-dependent hydrolase
VDLQGDNTRDILYACCLIQKRDTIHTLLCHLPSQLGGSANTETQRLITKRLLQSQVDSIRALQPTATIVIMGDMNTTPANDISGMCNLMLPLQQSGQGTHKYQGIWSCLDQFYLSSSLAAQAHVHIFAPEWLLEEDSKYLDKQPKRTYIGYRYHDGYSDHLPVVLRITK